MNTSADRLDLETHARVFAEEIVNESKLNVATSQARPRAIILAGQPGAGKGGLANAAERELLDDVVKIDPDELRDYHPRAAEFRDSNPYSWSARTHADAGQWADELREAATAGKKNFIFDTTLSNGPWTAELIKDLQAKGYEVEVRAVAAHKLESELGVDQRFARNLDRNGFGRHVPAGARDVIYDKVPASLDTIHAQTAVPIRIFNREGVELYDSRTDPRLPGAAMSEAREARLRDPHVTRGLSQGWKGQLDWHEALPDSVTRNPKLTPDTAERLLNERAAENVADGVMRDAAQARQIDHVTRVRPNVVKGLGIAGAAATAYDTADMLHDVSRSRSEGNGAATEDRVTRYTAQNLGGVAGAVAFGTMGAAAGVETGPGLLVTGAIGGVLGAIAGDKIADVIREHRINNQQDGKGNTWAFDPDAPARGWTRRELDLDAMRFSDGATVYKPGELKADAALSDLLTYKASSRSIELALGAPPQGRDPYRLPASAEEQAQRQPFETGRAWVRDAQTQQWQQEIRSSPDGRGSITRTEPASPERAAQLERQSLVVIADNASHTPAAMAAQFETAFANNGWSRHGDLPAAVIDAKAHPGRVVGSDGKRYDRSADGQWINDGLIWDSSAKGNLRHELESTFQHQQRSQRIITLDTVQVRPDRQRDDPRSGPGTSAAASAAAHHADPLAALTASDRALFDRIRRDVPAAIGDEHVMQTTLLARHSQIGGAAQVDRVATVGDRIFVQGTPDTGMARVAHDAGQAVSAVAVTAQQVQDINQQQEQSRQFAAAQPQAQVGLGR